MARHRIVGGKTTKERLSELYEWAVRNCERLPLTEVAHRAHISPSTLLHRHRDAAKMFRALRDGIPWKGAADPRSNHPTHAIDPYEVEATIKELRSEKSKLERRVRDVEAELGKLKKRANHLKAVEDQNERLRGVVVNLYQEMETHLGPEGVRRIIKKIETISFEGPDNIQKKVRASETTEVAHALFECGGKQQWNEGNGGLGNT